MKKGEENKMQQYREETKTERMLVFFSYHSENISLSKMKPGTSQDEAWNFPAGVRRQECSNLKEKLKSAPILKGNLKQRRIKNNRLCMYQALDKRHA